MKTLKRILVCLCILTTAFAVYSLAMISKGRLLTMDSDLGWFFSSFYRYFLIAAVLFWILFLIVALFSRQKEKAPSLSEAQNASRKKNKDKNKNKTNSKADAAGSIPEAPIEDAAPSVPAPESQTDALSISKAEEKIPGSIKEKEKSKPASVSTLSNSQTEQQKSASESITLKEGSAKKRFCPQCGTSREDTDKFCRTCGHSF